MSEKKFYLVESASTFRITYAVAANNPINGRVQHLIDANELKDLEQQFLGEKVVGIQPIGKKQLYKKLEEMYPSFKDSPEDVKMSLVNDLDTDVVEMLSDEEMK